MPEQFVEAAKSQLDSNLALIGALTKKTFSQFEKIISLNIATTKVAIQESNATFQKLISTRSPQEFFSITNAQIQPGIEQLRSYGRNLIEPTATLATEPVRNIKQTIVSKAEVAPAKKHPPAFVAAKQEAIQFATLPDKTSIPSVQPAILATPQVKALNKPQAPIKSSIEISAAKPAVTATAPETAVTKPAAAINSPIKPLADKISSKPAVKAAPIKSAVAGNQVWQAPKIKHPAKK